MWSMGLPESDIDLAHAYLVPSRAILEGRKYPRTLKQTGEVKQGRLHDEVWWEIGHLVDQLIKGNINAIWFVTTPLILKDHPAHQELRQIVLSNLSLATFSSLQGIVESLIRSAQNKPEFEDKGLRTALRTIWFGISLFRSGHLKFTPVNFSVSEVEILKALSDLEMAYENSELPKRPDEEPFREFLYRLRLQDIASPGISID